MIDHRNAIDYEFIFIPKFKYNILIKFNIFKKSSILKQIIINLKENIDKFYNCDYIINSIFRVVKNGLYSKIFLNYRDFVDIPHKIELKLLYKSNNRFSNCH